MTSLSPVAEKTCLPPALQQLKFLIQTENEMTPSRARDLLIQAGIQQEDLMDWADFDHPVENGYGRQLVYDGGFFEMLVMSWNPGDCSAINDHGHTQWGAVQIFGPAEHAVFLVQDGEITTLARAGIQPGQVLEMSFEAEATYIPTGQYCNIAWVEPEGSQTRTGATARITVGDPDDSVCASEKGDVDTSVTVEPDPIDPSRLHATYIIPIVNTNNVSLHLWWVRLKLPGGFAYLEGSTGGNITENDPLPISQQGRRQVLSWIWDDDKPTIPSYANDRYIAFDATAPTEPGSYFIETTVFFKEFNDQAYSWPDAVVKVMDTYEIKVKQGATIKTTSTVYLLGSDAEVVYNDTGQ